MRKFFQVCAGFGFHHYRIVLGLCLLLVATSAFFLRGLRFDTATAILKAKNPELVAYGEAAQRFGDSGPLIIRLLKQGVSISVFDQYTDTIASEISAWNDIRYVDTHPIDLSDTDSAAAILRAALVNAEPEILQDFASRFEDKNMEQELWRMRKKILIAADPELREALASDPLNIREVLLPIIEDRQGNLRFSSTGEYFDSEDGNSRLIFVHPQGMSEDTEYSLDLFQRVEEVLSRTLASTQGASPIRFALTGKYAHAAEGSSITLEDMRKISLLACLMIFLLIWAVFRRGRAILIAFIPLMISLLAVFLYARFFFNPLSPVAMAFAAILLGLGIDILLHFTGRLFQILPQVPSLKEAVRLTIEDCAPPVTIGIFTTAAAFFCMVFARFKALSQFGLLTSSSLVIMWIVCLFVFPALVRALLGQSKVLHKPRFQKVPGAIFNLSLNHSRWALSLGLILVVLSIFGASRFRFDMDLFKGLPDNMPSLETARAVAQDFGGSLILNTQILVQGNSLDQAMEAQEKIDQRLHTLVEEKKIAGFQSPSMFLPYPRRIEQHSAQIDRTAALIQKNRSHFFSLLESLKIRKTEAIETYYDLMERAFPRGGISIPEVLAAARNSRIQKHIKQDGKTFLQTLVWPLEEEGDLTKSRFIADYFSGFQSPNQSQVEVTGSILFFEKLNILIRSDFFRVSGISLAAVLFLTFLFFRRLKTVFIALFPLLMAVPFTFAALVVLGLSFTPAGIGMTAMIIGIGIDDAVHILTRMQKKPLNALPPLLREIGPILFLTSLSTMIGFSALSFSRLYSIRSMGFVVALGVFGCLLFSILLIPSLLKLLSPKKTSQKALMTFLICLFSSSLIIGSPQQDKKDRILNRLEKKYNTTETFSYRFKQIQSISQLTEPISHTGSLVFRRPHFIRMEMRGDENLNLYMDGESIWLEDLDLEEVERFDFERLNLEGRLSRLLPPVFLSSVTELKEAFNISLDKTADQDVLEIIPKDALVSSLKRIRFSVDSHSRIRWMRVDYTNGDWTETKFSKWRKLPKISRHYFRYRKAP